MYGLLARSASRHYCINPPQAWLPKSEEKRPERSPCDREASGDDDRSLRSPDDPCGLRIRRSAGNGFFAPTVRSVLFGGATALLRPVLATAGACLAVVTIYAGNRPGPLLSTLRGGSVSTILVFVALIASGYGSCVRLRRRPGAGVRSSASCWPRYSSGECCCAARWLGCRAVCSGEPRVDCRALDRDQLDGQLWSHRVDLAARHFHLAIDTSGGTRRATSCWAGGSPGGVPADQRTQYSAAGPCWW